MKERLGKTFGEIIELKSGFEKSLINTNNTKKRVENISLEKEIRREIARQNKGRAFANTYSGKATIDGLQSLFYEPITLDTHAWGNIHTISPYYGRKISYRILRQVSEKAWVLNLCVGNLIKKIRPFLKVSTNENTKGFRVLAKKAIDRPSGMTEIEIQEARKLEQFFINTGDFKDNQRTDDIDKFVSKIVRDLCQLDQVALEIQRTLGGDVCAFWAVDPATIEIVLPYSVEQTGIKYVQVIDNIPYAFYTEGEFIFDCMNPRTDIERAGYGYSIVEQAIDLVTSSINTFAFNAGFFVENKLPRGILLLNGDADSDEVEEIEEYIVNLMSGTPTSQWRVPIIPSGRASSGDGSGRKFEWVNLQGNNREMEYQAWYDLQLSGIVGLFGFSMEDLGLRSAKSAPLINNDSGIQAKTSRSLVLGDMLTFLQKIFNKILENKNPDYVFEFLGYEIEDLEIRLNLDKGEIESYKSIDEKRIEKGLKPFGEKWSSVPLNQNVTQMLTGEGEEDEGENAGGMMAGLGLGNKKDNERLATNEPPSETSSDEEGDDSFNNEPVDDENKKEAAGMEKRVVLNKGAKSKWGKIEKSFYKAMGKNLAQQKLSAVQKSINEPCEHCSTHNTSDCIVIEI